MTSPPSRETGPTPEERIKKALGLLSHATLEDIAFHVECTVMDAQRLHEEKMALLYPTCDPSAEGIAATVVEIRAAFKARGGTELIGRHIGQTVMAPILTRLVSAAKRSAHLEDARAVRGWLAFDNQRAVSWHEVQDCAEAIERGDALSLLPGGGR